MEFLVFPEMTMLESGGVSLNCSCDNGSAFVCGCYGSKCVCNDRAIPCGTLNCELKSRSYNCSINATISNGR